AGDIVKVYKHGDLKTLLGTGTVAAGKTDVTISLKDTGATAGSVDLTVTTKNKRESQVYEAAYEATPQTAKLKAEAVVATNNFAKADTIVVSGLPLGGNVVNVYAKTDDVKPLATATVAATATSATLSIAQLGADGGKVYISVLALGKTVSERLEVSFDKEPQTDAPTGSNVT
ncbi:hypothetical protein B5M42_025250, partial [Paenibacillus athensensis]